MIFKGVMSDSTDGGNGMFRYHFFEALVRYAIAKYKDNNVVGSTYEAVQLFFKNDVIKDESAGS